MHITNGTVLGISPGTRTMGLALLARDELIDAKIKELPGPWSGAKLERSLDIIGRIIEEYNVTAMVMKHSHPRHCSPGLIELIDGIKVLADMNGLPCRLISVKDMKAPHRSKRVLMQVVTDRFPELIHEYQSETRNKNRYHLKKFEAIACAYSQAK